jgi:hypothetical protein
MICLRFAGSTFDVRPGARRSTLQICRTWLHRNFGAMRAGGASRYKAGEA